MSFKAYKESIAAVLTHFKTNEQTGLSSADVTQRLAESGANKIPEAKQDSYLMIFLRQCNNAFLYLLMAAAVIKYFLEGYRDALIIGVIIFVNALIGAIQEGKAQSILASLKNYITTKCVVLRDGKTAIVEEKDLVPGDIIILQEGDRVPSDARIIEAAMLKIDEALLTGESEGVQKTEDLLEGELSTHEQTNMVFMGTLVISGNGKAVVTATGLNTQVGELKKTIETIDTEMPLKKDLTKLANIIIVGCLCSSVILFILGVYSGKSPETMLFTLSSLFVAVVPESVPAITTIVLAVGAYRMAQSNVLIKKLPAIEALGRIQVLVVDKTGTLTRNEQMVSELFIDDTHYTVTGRGYHHEGSILLNDEAIQPISETSKLWELGRAATLLDHSEVSFDENTKQLTLKGEPIQAALGVVGSKLGFDKIQTKQQNKLMNELPFDSTTRLYRACYKINGEALMLVSGSPETVMEHCANVSEATKKAFDAMLQQGLRIVAIASKTYPEDTCSTETENPHDLNFLGLLGMQDAIRENVGTTVQSVREAGMSIVMATGDHKDTALYVAESVNIFKSGDTVLEGKDVQVLLPEQLQQELKQTTVLARVTPQDKLNVVYGYHRLNKTVAMTGDGVNDVPALLAADVGIAMGTIGTEVAKDAADIVLLDDSLDSIIDGITQGRHILRILRRVIFYLFTTSMSEVLIITIALLSGLPLPLLATQILWENLVTDGFLDIGLSLEPKEPGLLQRNDFALSIFDRGHVIKLLIMAFTMALGTLAMFAKYQKTDLALARTMTLVTLSAFQWFNAWNLRSEERSLFAMPFFSNVWLVGLTVVVVILQVLAVYIPFLQVALHLVPLQFHHWLWALGVGSSILIVEEARKFIQAKTA